MFRADRQRGACRLLETSVPAILAIGGARAGSTKRVTAAVGEGSGRRGAARVLAAIEKRPAKASQRDDPDGHNPRTDNTEAK